MLVKLALAPPKYAEVHIIIATHTHTGPNSIKHLHSKTVNNFATILAVKINLAALKV